MTPSLKRQLGKTAVITRQPHAGEVGATTIATNVACSPPLPADDDLWTMGTTMNHYEILIDSTAAQKGYVLSIDGTNYTVDEVRRWPSFSYLLVRERR